MSRRGETAALVAVLLGAAALRAWRLDAMSIWQDEGLSLYRAGLNLRGVLGGRIPLDDLLTADVHPPLYFLLLAGWSRLVGPATWTARWLSLLAGLPAIALIWALGRRTVGRPAALLGAALAGVSPLYLWYSQEIRNYTLIVTLGLLSVYALWRATEPLPPGRRSLRWWALWPAAALLLLWTHYLGFTLVPVLLVALVAAGTRRVGARVFVAVAAVMVLAAPLVPFAANRLGIGAERDQRFVPFRVMALDVLRGFGFGRTLYHTEELTGWIGVAVAALLAVSTALLILGAVAAFRRSRRAGVLLTAYLAVPVVGVFVVTLVKPIYLGAYHLILASPPFYLLGAAGVTAVAARSAPRRAAATALAACLVLPAVVADGRLLGDPSFAKDDLRGLAQYVDAHSPPRAPGQPPLDVLAVSHPVLVRSFEHLVHNVELVAVPRMRADGTLDDRPAAEQLEPLLAAGRRLWFMTPAPEHAAWLARHAAIMDEQTFHGASIPVRVSAYERPLYDIRLASYRNEEPLDGAAVDMGGLYLTGWQGAGHGMAGDYARVGLYWQANRPGLPDYKVALRLLDAAGADWAAGDHEPFHGRRPVSTWPAHEHIVESHDLRIDPATPTGVYTLTATVYDPATGATHPRGGPLLLGRMQVVNPVDPPLDVDALPMTARVGAISASLEVLGLTLPQGERAPGERVPVTVWLRARRHDAATGSVRLELLDRRYRPVSHVQVDLDGTPGGDVDSGQVWALRTGLPAPASAGDYGLRMRVLGSDGAITWMLRGFLPARGLWAARIAVAPVASAAIPAAAHSLGLAVGPDARLEAYTADLAKVAPGAEVPIDLYWSALRPIDAPYHVTVQVVPTSGGGQASGPPVAQHDGGPGGGERPAPGWTVGEIIADPHVLRLPSSMGAGQYMLIAALYDPERPDMGRPIVMQDGVTRDFALLETFSVEGGGASEGPP